MNPISLILGAGAITALTKTSNMRKSIARWSIIIAVAIIVIVSLYYLIQSSLDVKNNKNASHNDFIAMNDKLSSISTQVSSISDRVSALEHPKPEASTFIGGRETFAPIPYMQELNLFKSMSPSEQGEYLSLSKSGKVAKYGNAF